MEIDNFDILMQHMDFVDPNDRYIVHIMRRPKDCKAIANSLGANEAQRLIRTYYIDNLDYMKAKIPAMKELCKSCNARAYLIVSPKDNFDCLMNLAQKTLETIRNKNYTVKPEHLLRQAYCENHKSRKKQWILDLDFDDNQMIEYKHTVNFGRSSYWTKTWTVEEVKTLIIEQLKEIQNEKMTKASEKYIIHPEDLVYEVPSKHGCSIVFPPINLIKTQEKCGLFFEGQKIFKEQKSIGPGEYEYIEHKITGWLHKDGMVNLYIPDF